MHYLYKILVCFVGIGISVGLFQLINESGKAYIKEFGVSKELANPITNTSNIILLKDKCVKTILNPNTLYNCDKINAPSIINNPKKIKEITHCIQIGGHCIDQREISCKPCGYEYSINCAYKNLTDSCKMKLKHEGYNNHLSSILDEMIPYNSFGKIPLTNSTKAICEVSCITDPLFHSDGTFSKLGEVVSTLTEQGKCCETKCFAYEPNKLCEVEKGLMIHLKRILYFIVNNTKYTSVILTKDCLGTDVQCISDFENTESNLKNVYYMLSDPNKNSYYPPSEFLYNFGKFLCFICGCIFLIICINTSSNYYESDRYKRD